MIENACVFQVAGKYCLREIALNNTTTKEKTLSGGCFKALLGITSGSHVLPTLRPRIAS